ncbi:MAG: hypothetical protein GX800_06850, partial [Clostridiaceae bacterium]|nr:hypothetical protein [Clostridiaceae bacterium]
LINYAYETEKAVRAYDENDKAAPVKVQIRDAEVRCIQFYYEWLERSSIEYDEDADYSSSNSYKRSWYGSGV